MLLIIAALLVLTACYMFWASGVLIASNETNSARMYAFSGSIAVIAGLIVTSVR